MRGEAATKDRFVVLLAAHESATIGPADVNARLGFTLELRPLRDTASDPLFKALEDDQIVVEKAKVQSGTFEIPALPSKLAGGAPSTIPAFKRRRQPRGEGPGPRQHGAGTRRRRERGLRWIVDLHGLDPVNETSGVQARLRNLGYDPGPLDGVLGARTRGAIASFQKDAGLDATGEADDATQKKLKETHVS